MPISRSGKYLGYTFGGGTPTLYFEEGRYTQVHTNPENVGWHPIIGDQYQVNISDATYDAITPLKTDSASVAAAKKVAKRALANDVRQDKVADSADPDGRLFEVSELNGKLTSTHTSRARLIRVGDPSFDPRFDATYAQSVLDVGTVAKNSTDSLLEPVNKAATDMQELMDQLVSDGVTPDEGFERCFDEIRDAHAAAEEAIRNGNFRGASDILAKASTRVETILDNRVSEMQGAESAALQNSIDALDQVSKNSNCISDENFEEGYEADDESSDYDPDEDEGEGEGGFDEI